MVLCIAWMNVESWFRSRYLSNDEIVDIHLFFDTQWRKYPPTKISRVYRSSRTVFVTEAICPNANLRAWRIHRTLAKRFFPIKTILTLYFPWHSPLLLILFPIHPRNNNLLASCFSVSKERQRSERSQIESVTNGARNARWQRGRYLHADPERVRNSGGSA